MIDIKDLPNSYQEDIKKAVKILKRKWCNRNIYIWFYCKWQF